MENFTYEKIEKVINFCVKKACKQFSLRKEDKEDIINNLWVHALQIKKEFDTSLNVEHCTAYLAKSIVRELAKEIDRVLLESVDRTGLPLSSTDEESNLTFKIDLQRFVASLSPKEQEILKTLYLGYTREEMAEKFGKKAVQAFDYTVRSIRRKYLRFFREKNIFKT